MCLPYLSSDVRYGVVSPVTSVTSLDAHVVCRNASQKISIFFYPQRRKSKNLKVLNSEAMKVNIDNAHTLVF